MQHDWTQYEIRTGDDGGAALLLWQFNVRVATFGSNTHDLQSATRAVIGGEGHEEGTVPETRTPKVASKR
jgi:hypothetical protein